MERRASAFFLCPCHSYAYSALTPTQYFFWCIFRGVMTGRGVVSGCGFGVWLLIALAVVVIGFWPWVFGWWLWLTCFMRRYGGVGGDSRSHG